MWPDMRMVVPTASVRAVDITRKESPMCVYPDPEQQGRFMARMERAYRQEQERSNSYMKPSKNAASLKKLVADSTTESEPEQMELPFK
jgi:hypothetical protein